jgi:hypothetical protein
MMNYETPGMKMLSTALMLGISCVGCAPSGASCTPVGETLEQIGTGGRPGARRGL